MKKGLFQEGKQLNTRSARDLTPHMDFTIDDIVAEFGTEAQTAIPPKEEKVIPPKTETPIPVEEPAETQEETVRIWTPRGEELSQEPQKQEKPKKEKKVKPPKAEKVKQEKVKKEKPPKKAKKALLEETAEETPVAVEEAPAVMEKPAFAEEKKPRFTLVRPAEEEIPLKEDPIPATPQDMLSSLRKRIPARRGCIIALWVLLLISVVFTSLALSPLQEKLPFTEFVYNAISAGVLLVQCILCYPMFRGAVLSLGKKRFTLSAMLLLLSLMALSHGIVSLFGEGLSLATAASVVLTMGAWGEYLALSAQYHTLHTAVHMEEPLSASRYDEVFEDLDGIYRTAGDISTLSADLEETSLPDKIVSATSLILTALSLFLGGLLALRADADFLRTMTVLLLGACPVGGALAWSRTFCKAAKYLKTCGAALAGYEGSCALSGDEAVIMTDEDIFPPSHVSLHGYKVFGSQMPERVLGYAEALIRRSGATHLLKTFHDAGAPANGYPVGDFREYTAGGLGGEIHGSVVLLGNLNFMELMQVSMPQDVRIRQALYLSVDGECQGVFVLRYRPSDAVRSGLSAILSCRYLTPVLATRDILLSPAMVKDQYGIPGDFLEYPMAEERAEMAKVPETDGKQGAFLARDSFLSFAVAIAVGRQCKSSAMTTAILSVVAATLGFFLMAVLLLTGAHAAIGVLRLVVYHLLWLIPTAILTAHIRK
ncbi:MAG: hypothetical protein J6K84_05530 [Oscillospiraceae bacterium]|nr:hypothetical protein [Oscillospiraceae bacterium]